jgi:uncharacterized membrane protein YphA (DoxX/SURF4 family)
MMLRILFGVFMVLHGLVHLMYFGQSGRYFELQPGMAWPDGSWAFSRFPGNEAARSLAGILLILAALGLVAGGIGILLGQTWWRPVVIASSVFSALLFLLFWDGITQALDSKGAVGILINLAILALLLVLKWSPVTPVK